MLAFMCTVHKLKPGNILDNIMYGKYFECIFPVLLKLYFQTVPSLPRITFAGTLMGLSSSSKTYNTQVGVQPLKSMLISIPAEGIKSKSNK